jgi:predicted nucleic acid-binding protein
VETFLDFGIPTISTRDLLRQAAHLAHATGCSVYDGMYVALALVSGHPLLTADERLANALSPRFPVHWLGLI